MLQADDQFFDHFENGEKDQHHLALRSGALEHSAGADFGLLVNRQANLGDLLGHRHLFALDLDFDQGALPVEDFAEDIEKLKDRRRHFRVLFVGLKRAAREGGRLDQGALMQRVRRTFEFLMFEQLMNEFGARVFKLFFRDVRIVRQQHLRFDVNQRRRHD